jgi:elongation factor Ts
LRESPKIGSGANGGIIESSIHDGGRIGVLMQLDRETDFIAKNSQFKQLTHDICMQIARVHSSDVSRESVPVDLVNSFRISDVPPGCDAYEFALGV